MRDRFVFFDLGNVLIHFDHQIAVRQLAALSGRSEELVQACLFGSELQQRYECGQLTCGEFTERVNTALGVRLPEADILEAISNIFTLNEAILPVLEQLRAEQIRLGILSNTCPAHWSWIARQGWAIPGAWFDVQVLSYEVRSMKPDSAIYRVCEQRSGHLPGELFFTDDRPENVEAAKRRGWQAHLFQSVSSLQAELGRWLGGDAVGGR